MAAEILLSVFFPFKLNLVEILYLFMNHCSYLYGKKKIGSIDAYFLYQEQ